MKNPKIQVTLPQDMLNVLKDISKDSGNPVSSIIRLAIAEYVKKQNEMKE